MKGYKQPKRLLFHWQGTNEAGKFVKGEQLAINPRLLNDSLKKQKISVHQIKKKVKPLFSSRKIKNTEITIFTRQIATMLTAGIPLIQAFTLIGRGQSKPAMRNLIGCLQTSIEQGNSVASALSEYPRYFNELYRTLVRAGEHSGALDILLDRLATYKEKTEILVRKIKKALYYPIAIILVALLVLVALLMFVIPQFQMLYTGFGAVLPAPTRFVIYLSQLVQSCWWFLLLGLIIASAIFTFAQRNFFGFALAMDQLLLRLPIFGVIFKKSAIAKFARTLATTFSAGMPLVSALQVVSGVTGNRNFTSAILKICENVTIGQSLHASIRETKLFPDMVVQMIAVGEESGTLEKMLNKIADIFEQNVDHVIEEMSSLLEPFIMIILGTLIGGFVITMYLPIFKLGSVI